MEYASTGAWGSGTSSRVLPRSSFVGSTQPQHGASQAPQSKLNFEQAMADFQTMFPDMDVQVIEETLRANEGAVESTIDQLLTMSSQSTQQTVDVKGDGRVKSTPAVLARTKYSRWKPALVGPLPDDFLRLVSPQNVRMDSYVPPVQRHSLTNVGQVIDPKKNNERNVSLINTTKKSSSKNKISSLSTSPETNQFNDDNFNQFLQNEEFLKELQQDEEFMNALQKDAKLRAGRDNSAFLSNIDGPTSSASLQSTSSTHPSAEDGADFQNKLKKNMGLLAKQRLNLFAKQFSRGKKKSAKTLLNKGTPSSYDHLIEDSNSLVSDEEDHLVEGVAHVRLETKKSNVN